jgi:glycosyltransferase involved in cell wall biosynthesis
VAQGDVSGLVEAIETWQENPELTDKQAMNARRTFEENFTTDASIDEYYRMLTGPQSLDR